MKLARLLGIDYLREGYPTVDLSTKEQVARQLLNAASFKKIQVRLFWSVAAVIGAVALQITLNQRGNSSLSPMQSALLAFLTLIAIAANVVVALTYRCPNCRSTPNGVAVKLGGEGVASISRGIHPFPVRCKKCGFYLSKRQIEADLKHQQQQQ